MTAISNEIYSTLALLRMSKPDPPTLFNDMGDYTWMKLWIKTMISEKLHIKSLELKDFYFFLGFVQQSK